MNENNCVVSNLASALQLLSQKTNILKKVLMSMGLEKYRIMVKIASRLFITLEAKIHSVLYVLLIAHNVAK